LVIGFKPVSFIYAGPLLAVVSYRVTLSKDVIETYETAVDT
jgi:hypothetical protein